MWCEPAARHTDGGSPRGDRPGGFQPKPGSERQDNLQARLGPDWPIFRLSVLGWLRREKVGGEIHFAKGGEQGYSACSVILQVFRN